MSKKITSWVLILLVATTVFLKIYKLDSNPGQLNRDEAALAYNSLLLKEVGRDEWRRVWPITLESFGDYKLVGYPAVLAVFFGFFGYSDFIVRIPSAISGLAIALLGMLYLKELKVSKKYQWLIFFSIALYGTFYFYSRMAFEAMLSLSLFLTAIYLINKYQFKYRLLSFGLLFLSAITYNTPLFYIPLIPIGALFIDLKLSKKLISTTLWSLLITGLLLFLFSGLISQKSGITVLNEPGVIYDSTFSLMSKIARNYIAHLSPWFLVIRGGGHPWHTLPNFGHISWLVYLSAAVGILYSVLNLRDARYRVLIFWLIVSIIPGSISVDAPHATRSLLTIFLIFVASGLGMANIEKYLARNFHFKTGHVFSAFLIITLISTLYYQYSYHIKFPYQQAYNYQLGFKEVISEANAKYYGEPTAVVDSSGYLYILTAWYSRMKPDYFYETVVKQLPDRINLRYGEKVGQYHFVAREDDRYEDELVIIKPINDNKAWSIERK